MIILPRIFDTVTYIWNVMIILPCRLDTSYYATTYIWHFVTILPGTFDTIYYAVTYLWHFVKFKRTINTSCCMCSFKYVCTSSRFCFALREQQWSLQQGWCLPQADSLYVSHRTLTSSSSGELCEMISQSVKTIPAFVWIWNFITAFARVCLQAVDNLMTKYCTLCFLLTFTDTADLTAYPGGYRLYAMWCETINKRPCILVMIKFNVFNIICFFPEIQYSAIILTV
jgi:hypothetical protein